jgi:hypothetical protein
MPDVPVEAPFAAPVPRDPPTPRGVNWSMLALPVTLPAAVAWHAVLLLPYTTKRNVKAWWRCLLVVLGLAVVTRLLVVKHAVSWMRGEIFDWYWAEARYLLLPRLFDGLYRSIRDEYVVAHHPWDIWILVAALVAAFGTGLFLLWSLVLGARLSVSLDRSHPLPLPYPKIRSLTPWGIGANFLVCVLWGCLPALYVLLLPPTVSTAFASPYEMTRTSRGPAWLWDRLQVLYYPRLLNPAVEHFERELPLERLRFRGRLRQVDGPERTAMELYWWSGQRKRLDPATRKLMPPPPSSYPPLGVHWNRALLAILGLEIGVIAVAATAVLTAASAWYVWATRNDWARSGPRHRTA